MIFSETSHFPHLETIEERAKKEALEQEIVKEVNEIVDIIFIHLLLL